MSRDPYRSSFGGGERWDSERFAIERDRNRINIDRERYEERDSRVTRGSGFGRTRERSVDEIYRRPSGYEEDRYERREYYGEEPRFAREGARDRGPSITIEKERERIYSPSPPPPLRRAPLRPGIIRRQSSLDTFDRRPLARLEREEYGPPARYREQVPLPPLTPIPLPRTRALPPPRRYAEREYYDEIKVAEPDFYGDDDYRGYPERIREREIIRRRRSRSHGRSVKSSVRSSSAGSSSSSSGTETVRTEFPKRGKTRMPARLVSKRAIEDLGYTYTEEGDTVIIQKALGRENIDEVIKLSEDYKADERIEVRSTSGDTVYEERRQEVITTPAHHTTTEVVTDTKVVRRASPSPARSHRSHHSHHHSNPVIVEARPREESTLVERKIQTIERSDEIPIGPLALAIPEHRSRVKDERAIRAEIKALEAEKEALRAERKADREMRKADRIRHGGRVSEGDLVLYERDRYDGPGEEVTLVRRERVVEPDGGVRIEKDRKGRMSISVPKYAR